MSQGWSQACCNLSVLAGSSQRLSVGGTLLHYSSDRWLAVAAAEPEGVCVWVFFFVRRGRWITKHEEERFLLCVLICVKVLISWHKLHSRVFCLWFLPRDPGCDSNPPGRVLQSAADFAHLLFPKIHHCQMDPAVLTHTDLPVHKDTEEGTLWKRSQTEWGWITGRKEEHFLRSTFLACFEFIDKLLQSASQMCLFTAFQCVFDLFEFWIGIR